MSHLLKASTLALILSSIAPADVGEVKTEPNLERRSQLALEHAEKEIDEAKKAYDDGDLKLFQQKVTEVGDLAQLSYDSLEETGKRARRKPKWFKRAEQKLLVVVRKLDSLEKVVGIDDRNTVVAVRKRVSGVHDQILNDIMTRK